MIRSLALLAVAGSAAMSQDARQMQVEFETTVRPVVRKLCHQCHAGDRVEAEIDLAAFRTMADVAAKPKVWVRVLEMLETEQMPPVDAPQLTDPQRTQLKAWARRFLIHEARARAGDPGPVLLRRLSNAEYTYSVRDLTGLSALDPTREFPVDGAAGEGFTNVGGALVMSPSLLQKFLDAARSVSEHAALYPEGIRFTPHLSARDRTDAAMERIREFYSRFTSAGGGITVNLSGRPFKTNQGGMLPLPDYIRATIEEREAIRNGKSLRLVASERSLSPKYLTRLWNALNSTSPSPFLGPVREQWRHANANDVAAVTTRIQTWSHRLWKFNIVGHLGRQGAPASWMEPVDPIVERREFRMPLKPVDGQVVVVRLSASDAGDGNRGDYVLWRDMRLEGGAAPPLPLRFVAPLQTRLNRQRQDLLSRLGEYLAAADEIADGASLSDVAVRRTLPTGVLEAWLRYLDIDVGGPVEVSGHYTRRMHNVAGYSFVNGWGGPETPSVISNASDGAVRVPGLMKPRVLGMHPSPTLYTAIGWQSPIDGRVVVTAKIADAHPTCGNGAEWFVRHQSATSTTTLGAGVFNTNGSGQLDSKIVQVRRGELISLLVGPRDGNHACDQTEFHFTIAEADGARRVWNAAADLVDTIARENPHADSFGNKATWHLYKGEMSSLKAAPTIGPRVRAGSLLAAWRTEQQAEQRKSLRTKLVAWASRSAGSSEAEPDRQVRSDLASLPIGLSDQLLAGLEPDKRFGMHPLGHRIDPDHIVVRAPSTIEFRIPATLAAGRDLIIAGMGDVEHGREASTQLHASIDSPEPVPAAGDIVCFNDSAVKGKLLEQFREFRELFPPALCYTRIVPVDEVVTATLFHRDDRLMQELMLNDNQTAELNRLWDDLSWVSEEPLKFVVALEQIREFSTQDRQDLVTPWDRMKPAANARAEAFRRRVEHAEPNHIASVLSLASRAWRRKLSGPEEASLRDLYAQLRRDGSNHEQAIRMLLTRVLTSPSFLYRREVPVSGAAPGRVTGAELATRLSYFLTSSVPDRALTTAAAAGRLQNDDELVQHTRRLLSQPTARRLAEHFFCQWMHLRNFEESTEKNEKLYPEFSELRSAMNDEPIRFFEDLIRSDRSILEVFDSDHAMLNQQLAKLYGVEGVEGADWRRVGGMKAVGRGGVLGMSAFLASQSGASRTSPILRGTWVSETVLGERLPKPPANVPVLPESVPQGLTARQLIERHSSLPACARCHRRIDPYGFALEQFDTLGRLRDEKADTAAELPDGSTIRDAHGLRDYLLTRRRDDVVRQFCRKLLGYALGREVLLSDEELLQRMQTQLEANDYRFSAAVETIVLSRQFRMIRGESQ